MATIAKIALINNEITLVKHAIEEIAFYHEQNNNPDIARRYDFIMNKINKAEKKSLRRQTEEKQADLL